VILFVRGEIGLATAPHFEAALTAHLRRQFRTPTAGLCAVTFLGRGTLSGLTEPLDASAPPARAAVSPAQPTTARVTG
jgi:hypothetical protein